MAKYKIRYDMNGCIGAGACAAANPDLFEMNEENKAVLKGGVEVEPGVFELEIEGDHKIIDAAKSCPVEVIKVTDLDSGKEIV